MENKAANNSLTGRPMAANKAELRQIFEARDRQTGFVLDADATPQKARELVHGQAIRPEDGAFSRDIRRLRDGK